MFLCGKKYKKWWISTPREEKTNTVTTIDSNLIQKSSLIHLEALGIICQKLSSYTQKAIQNGYLPEKYQEYFIQRGYDTQFLIEKNIFNNNILFLNSRFQLTGSLKEELETREYDYKQTSLFKSDGELCWLHDSSFCLLFPLWNITDTPEGIKPTVTSIRVRNVARKTNFPKEVELITSRDESFDSEGFIGLHYAYDQFPEAVSDKFKGLTVLLVEGSTDFIAAYELIHKFNLIERRHQNEKIVILTGGGIYNTAKEKNLQLIKKCTRLIVSFDNDDAGEDGFKKVLGTSKKIGIEDVEKCVKFDGYKDLNDYLIALKTKTWDEDSSKSPSFCDFSNNIT